MQFRALQRVSVRPIQVLLAALLLAPLLALSPPPRPASSGMAVAEGTVTSTTGSAMPSVAVDLYAWPSDAVLQALKLGQLVPTTLLATATTSNAGVYRLTVPAAKLKAAAVESGYANLEIYSPVSGMSFFSYQTGGVPGRPPAPVIENLSPDIGVNCGTNSIGQPYAFSGFFKIKQLHHAWAIVGQGYIAKSNKTKGDSMLFNYNQTATKNQTSTLGLGVSGKAIDVGYHSDGTSDSTATAEQDYPSQTENTWFRTYFNVALFRGECHGHPGDNSFPQQKQHGYCPRKYVPIPSLVYYTRKCFWMVKSTGWFGPSGNLQHRIHGHPIPVPATKAKFCGPEPRGGGAKTSKQKAVQWSSGFDIGASNDVKGVTLKVSFGSSAQTGYDANDQMIFTFRHAGFICGTNKDPLNAAQLVMRGNKT